MFSPYPAQGPQEEPHPPLTTDDWSQDSHAFKLMFRNGFAQDEASKTGERMELTLEWPGQVPTGHLPGFGKYHPFPAQNVCCNHRIDCSFLPENMVGPTLQPSGSHQQLRWDSDQGENYFHGPRMRDPDAHCAGWLYVNLRQTYTYLGRRNLH